MYLSQVIELKPNKTIQNIFKQSFGYSRQIYNKALDEWKRMYNLHLEDKNNPKPTHRRVRDNLKTMREPWEESQLKMVLETATEDLGKAYNMMWKTHSKYPKYKKKNRDKNSFRIYRKNEFNIRIIDNKYLRFHGLPYNIRMKEKLKLDGIIKEVTISERANKYFASFVVEVNQDDYFKNTNDEFVGIDLGVKDLAIINDSNDNLMKYKSLNKLLLPYYNKIDFYNKACLYENR